MAEYRDEYHPKVKKDLKRIDKSIKSKVRNFHIPKILNDPYNADDLSGDLSYIWSYHFKSDKVQYRISYIINEVQKIVYILMIGKRESFYEILRRRL